MKNSFHNFSEVQKYFAPGQPQSGVEARETQEIPASKDTQSLMRQAADLDNDPKTRMEAAEALQRAKEQ
mgnify:CR=1 FL=1